jgi:hypothetical protein
MAPEPRTTTRSFEVRPAVRLLTAACIAARMSVPVYVTLLPRRAVQVLPFSTASAWYEPSPHAAACCGAALAGAVSRAAPVRRAVAHAPATPARLPRAPAVVGGWLVLLVLLVLSVLGVLVVLRMR